MTMYGLFVDMPSLAFKPEGLDVTTFDSFVAAIGGGAGTPEITNTMTRVFLTQSVSVSW